MTLETIMLYGAILAGVLTPLACVLAVRLGMAQRRRAKLKRLREAL